MISNGTSNNLKMTSFASTPVTRKRKESFGVLVASLINSNKEANKNKEVIIDGCLKKEAVVIRGSPYTVSVVLNKSKG